MALLAEFLRRKREHALQGHTRPVRGFGIDLDLIDDLVLEERFQDPGEIGRVDAIHGGARTDNRIKAENVLLGMLFGEAMHQIDLGGHPPLSASGSALDLLNDILGRAIEVGSFYNFTATLG